MPRGNSERLARLIDGLAGCWPKAEIMRFLTLHQNQRIPVAISIEVLERVAAVRPANVWGFVNAVMHRDYPHHCGRR